MLWTEWSGIRKKKVIRIRARVDTLCVSVFCWQKVAESYGSCGTRVSCGLHWCKSGVSPLITAELCWGKAEVKKKKNQTSFAQTLPPPLPLCWHKSGTFKGSGNCISRSPMPQTKAFSLTNISVQNQPKKQTRYSIISRLLYLSVAVSRQPNRCMLCLLLGKTNPSKDNPMQCNHKQQLQNKNTLQRPKGTGGNGRFF